MLLYKDKVGEVLYMKYTFLSLSSEETLELGKRLGKMLNPGDIVCLEGELGAGKTLLTKGIAAGMGIERPITSPTFTLINQYPGKVPLYHFDVYRLEGSEELYEVGGEELLYGDGVSVIEWASRVEDILPRERLWIRISHVPGREFQRLIEITAVGERYQKVLKGVKGDENTGN